MSKNIFQDLDFNLLNGENFKEDSVREVLINPFLQSLGYDVQGDFIIIRSKHVRNPYVYIGTSKKQITQIPDYILEVKGEYAWVLDAKAPNEDITTGQNVEQVYSYALHPDIKVMFYALCNGHEFILFKMNEKEPVLYFHLSEIEKHWDKIKTHLSPQVFIKEIEIKKNNNNNGFDYLTRKILPELPVRKRASRRHFGVHGYFTKQSWNVVQEYIKNFTKPGDIVLDPYGGSGVTLVEALMTGRKAIHIDINPMANFIVDSLLSPVDFKKMQDEFESIKIAYKQHHPVKKDEINNALKKYKYPRGLKLPKNSDVDKIEDLFTPLQLAQLSYLKFLIKKVKDKNIKKTLLLVFSTTITKINKTYHHSSYASPNAGNAAPFAYY
ncbi:MAG: type I restriction enzyme HsdR N-terminal domain-containing protein, partial [Bacteroidetes bacterium]|nr:type I restriction enzyme HsdR N-terminal domain-containing protein [Bacteroidota bacterium]